MLGLQGEQEAGGEAVNLQDARLPVGVIQGLEVPVYSADDVVDDSEETPGEVEAGGEHEYTVTPG